MTVKSARILYWAPRALSIAFIAFLSLFALDTFHEAYGFWKTLASLAMHLLPTFVLVAVLILAWRWEWIGAAIFAAAGLLYIISVVPKPLSPSVKLNWILTIAGPAFVIAALFLGAWLKRGQLRPQH